jgi:AraC family ethanolamine operon transcriptional activator
VLHSNAQIVSFPMTRRRPGRINGAETIGAHLWLARDGAEFDLVQPDSWLMANIVLGPPSASGVGLHDPDRPLLLFNVSENDLSAVRDVVRRVLRAAENSASLDDPVVAELIRDATVVALSQIEVDVPRKGLEPIAFRSAQQLARRIDDYIAQGGPGRVRMEELSRELGRSVKTVHQSIVAVKGMSLGRYLLQKRLWEARQALRTASPTTLIKTIALEHGFWHLGRFTQRYLEAFGELPSETLRAQRG